MSVKQYDEDFASAVMMRLISAGLNKQGIRLPMQEPRGARVPRSSKRAFLEDVADGHGYLAVLSIADAVHDMPPEPVALALKKATGLSDLLRRWRKVEAFSHNTNRVVSTPTATDTYILQHVGKTGGPHPTPAESLLVIGVVTALGEIATGSHLELHTEQGQCLRSKGQWHAPDLSDWTGAFQLREKPGQMLAPRSEPAGQHDLIATTKDLIAQDLVRRWSLQDLAKDTGTSARTLQRRLKEGGVSFSRLVSEARLEAAADYLCSADGPSLSAIGFLSGYSDQAHFSRAFAEHVGIPPNDYRERFSS